MADDLQGKASDFVKKILTVGVGTIFLTEEALKNLVSELKLPKELLTGVLESASKTKNEFLSRLSKDVLDRVMQKVQLESLVQEVLAKNEIEVTIRFKSKGSSDPEPRSKD